MIKRQFGLVVVTVSINILIYLYYWRWRNIRIGGLIDLPSYLGFPMNALLIVPWLFNLLKLNSISLLTLNNSLTHGNNFKCWRLHTFIPLYILSYLLALFFVFSNSQSLNKSFFISLIYRTHFPQSLDRLHVSRTFSFGTWGASAVIMDFCGWLWRNFISWKNVLCESGVETRRAVVDSDVVDVFSHVYLFIIIEIAGF